MKNEWKKRKRTIISVLLLLSFLFAPAADAKSDIITIKNKAGQINEIKKAMLKRQKTVKLTYNGSKDDLELDLKKLMESVFDESKAQTSDEGDYLRYVYKGCKVNYSYTSYRIQLNYQFEYLDTQAQAKKVNQTVQQLIKKMNLNKKSDYQKIKQIHDYIVNHVTYDKGYTKYSAYNALIEGKSLCQGYSLLAYKMYQEAGIPCRIITGLGNGGAHSWNIVKLNGKWYNIDCTFDDPITSTGKQVLQYDFFLKNDKDFIKHTRDAEYRTKEFIKQYPIAEKSYTMPKNTKINSKAA